MSSPKASKNATLGGTPVSGNTPFAALGDMAATSGLKFLKPTLAMARSRTAVSQGDRSLRADRARRETGVTGKNVRVDVLSDSFD